MNKYFTFEVQVLDDKNVRRRFRASTFQSCTRVKDFICTMPMRLDDGWNQIQFNLADFTRRAYGTNYVEPLRVHVHANCRLRRIYFSDRLYAEEEVPAEFKVFLPIAEQEKQEKQEKKHKQHPAPIKHKEAAPRRGRGKKEEEGQMQMQMQIAAEEEEKVEEQVVVEEAKKEEGGDPIITDDCLVVEGHKGGEGEGDGEGQEQHQDGLLLEVLPVEQGLDVAAAAGVGVEDADK